MYMIQPSPQVSVKVQYFINNLWKETMGRLQALYSSGTYWGGGAQGAHAPPLPCLFVVISGLL